MNITTPYHIQIAPTARRQLLTLSPKFQALFIKLIETLAINPRPPTVTRLEGMTGLYSQSIHYHRLIYKIEEQEVLILLVK